jgi:hypothetical protein
MLLKGIASKATFSIGNRRLSYSIGSSSKVSNLGIAFSVRWRYEEHLKTQIYKKSDCLEASLERPETNEMPLFIHFIISCNNAGTLNFVSFSSTIRDLSLSPLFPPERDMALIILHPYGISCCSLSSTSQIILHTLH